MQISMSALAAETAKSAMPMSVFSRPTEASNQDVVSMGTIAARDLMTISSMAMDVAAIQCLALCQAFYLRREAGQEPPLTAGARDILEQWARIFPMQREDRALDGTIQAMKSQIFGVLAWS
jgi:histidine ammonia-lyase